MAIDPNKISEQAQRVAEKGTDVAVRATLGVVGAAAGIGWGILKQAARTTGTVINDKFPGLKEAFSDEEK